MALKFKYAKKEEVPAEHAALYIEREGAFVLDADGIVEKAKLEEFRATNVAVMKERDELRQRFEGINPDEVRKLATEKQRLEDEQRIKAGEADKVIEARLKAARVEWDKQGASVVAERDALHARLTAIQIDQAVVAEATKRGLRASAIPDLTARAHKTFKLVNGVPQAFDGEQVRPGKDGPMTVAEWVEALVSDAAHLFEANAGGGAAGSTSGGSAGARSLGAGRNPFRRETWNLTEQMKLTKADPALAARLKAAS